MRRGNPGLSVSTKHDSESDIHDFHVGIAYEAECGGEVIFVALVGAAAGRQVGAPFPYVATDVMEAHRVGGQ